MKISEKWLREWVDTDVDTDMIVERLIMSGTELDGVFPVASAFTNVVVGQIKSIEPHPDADRLRVCQVDVGANEQIQIVTNASIALEQKVPVAMIGANLPDAEGKPFKIKKSKLRGVLSQGMFCGAETLGMGEAGEGLLAVPEEAPLGADLREVMALDDVVLDLDATPNRADLLSVAGTARELGVILQAPVNGPEIDALDSTLEETFPVSIDADDLCQRYVGRIIRDVNVSAATPIWIKERLRRSDIRSLGAVVDITNYVMLELGQPMHGFDFDNLKGGMRIRRANEGEKLVLLDGKEVTLRSDTLVIADEERALALAGIMGGVSSAVSDSTRHIYLESAFFTPDKIMGQARSYGLHTDSSHRFERGVSPDLQHRAMDRATQLIVQICGGQVGPVTDTITREGLLKRPAIAFQRSRIQRHLGIEVPDDRVVDCLTRLGCEIDTKQDGWTVTPAVFRFDLERQEDLIEEIARIVGYDAIPARLRPMTPIVTQPSETRVRETRLHDLLIDRGYQEAITYSFVPANVERLLAPESEPIRLSNPISEELSIMRSTLWSGLIAALDKNVKRQQHRVRLFETGLSFQQTGDGLQQRKKLAGVITGSRFPEQWSQAESPVDFFDIKGDVEVLLNEASGLRYDFEPAEHAALHPGQAARIVRDGTTVGYCGALHPSVEKELDLDQPVFVFELDVEQLLDKKLPVYHQLSKYPSIRRDIALLVDEEVDYASIQQVLQNSGIAALINYQLFDVYTGEKLDKGQKSLALGLIFQDFSRTLEEQEINGFVDAIIDSLHKKTGAVLR